MQAPTSVESEDFGPVVSHGALLPRLHYTQQPGGDAPGFQPTPR